MKVVTTDRTFLPVGKTRDYWEKRFVDNNYTSLSKCPRDSSVCPVLNWNFCCLHFVISIVTFENLHGGLCGSTICHGGHLPSVPFSLLRNCVSVNGWVGWLLSPYFIDARIIGAENPKPWQNKNRPHLLLPLSVPHSSWLESRVRFRGQDGCLVKLCQQPSCMPATLLHLSVTGLPARLSSQLLLFRFGNGLSCVYHE